VAKAKPAPAKSLLDDVLLRAQGRKPGFKSWVERLPAEAQAELEQVRQAFDNNVHQKNAYADSIMECCRERGWATCGRQGVIDWLNKR
jgi:hypothetical protein